MRVFNAGQIQASIKMSLYYNVAVVNIKNLEYWTEQKNDVRNIPDVNKLVLVAVHL